MSQNRLISAFLLIGLALSLAGVEMVFAQHLSPESGRALFVERYQTHLLDGHDQNWWVAQDSRGIIWVANWWGVFEFDGTTWRLHEIPNRHVRSLAVGHDDRVYVGGIGEVGVLIPDENGTYTYESFVPLLPEGDRSFADVWTTYVGSDGVYFQSFRYVLRWNGKELTRWESATRFHKGFSVRGVYYTREEGVGLKRSNGTALTLVDGGEAFADERIDALLPHESGGLIIITRSRGVLALNEGRIAPLSTDLNEYLRSERVYQGAVLNDSTFALSTFSGTVALADTRGRVIQVLGEDAKLSKDDLVLHVAPDRQGGLWLALNRGLIRVDAPAAVQIFDQDNGLRGRVNHMGQYHGSLYAATSHGLFRLLPAVQQSDPPRSQARFEPVPLITQEVWHIQIMADRLLAATDEGVFDVSTAPAVRILPDKAVALAASQRDAALAYVGLKEGMAILRWNGVRWETVDRLDQSSIGEVRWIVEANDGSLWLGMVSEGVVRLRMVGDGLPRITRYGEEQGLGRSPVTVGLIGDELLFVTRDGPFRLDESSGAPRFILDPTMSEVGNLAESAAPLLLNSDDRGSIWTVRDGQITMLERNASGGYMDATPAALRFRGLTAASILQESNGTVWVTTDQGLIRYDPSIARPYDAPYAALIRKVITRGGDVLFGGNMAAGFRAPDVTYAVNSLRFEFAAPTYNRPDETRFQYWLEGFDDGWSDWTYAREKEYTNLPERTYRFHVRAQNAQGVISEIGTFTFRILPPWYRTWWAYTLYLVAGALVLWGYGHWRIRKHFAALARERDVRQRIEIANARLKKANERLHLADKLKDDLLANTSHELRTPLTSILGFAAVLEEELHGEHRDFAAHIQRGGQRLLSTVNALLDMARFRADVITVDPDDVDVIKEITVVMAAHTSRAHSKGLFLEVLPVGVSLPARIDSGALERIVSNLVSNAIKFTDRGGVTVLVDADADNIFLSVKDTGIGIRKEFLPHLFSAFSQASSGYARTYEGNGLGLAITHRLVRALEGDIDVESSESGSVFRVRLPRWASAGGAVDGTVSTSLAGRRLLMVGEEPVPGQLPAMLSGLASVDVSSDLNEAIHLARQNVYDLVLVTGHYDGGVAQATLGALRAVPGTAQARFVAVTPFTLPGDREHFQAIGFDEHVGRPFSRERLLLIMEALLIRVTAQAEQSEVINPV